MKRKMRIVVEYEADTKHYPSKDPAKMAEVDQANVVDLLYNLMEDDGVVVTVEPVVEKSSPFGEAPPERIFWCRTCNGGVGCWGVDSDDPPPRCPDCHTSNFDPTKFVPTKAPTVEEMGMIAVDDADEDDDDDFRY